MPNFSGVWNLKEQIQAIAAGRWTGIPFGELYAWGKNNTGQLGDGTTASKSSPVQIAGANWAQVSGGNDHTASVKDDGTLWTWGKNQFGRLGDGTVVYRSSPIQVGALTNWAQPAAGTTHTACVKTDGTLWTWGDNSPGGPLGDGTSLPRSSPVQVGALTDWAQVSAGNLFTACVKTDGTLWTWGSANDGKLGHNNAIARSSPVQVGALTNWAQVSATNDFTACVKTDNTLFAWGQNVNFGQLGQGNKIARSSPVQVGALTNWAQVSAGNSVCISVKTDGTLWSWGANPHGQLGHNERIDKSSPVQVGALLDWLQATTNSSTACVKTDGTLWSWGENSYGELGQNNAIPRSSPIQVGASTGWSQVSSGDRFTLAILEGITN